MCSYETAFRRAKETALTVGLLLVFSLTATASDGIWTNASGGSWGDGPNWLNAAPPSNGHAFLTLTGSSYTVAYEAAAPAISNLVVSNRTPWQTTLVIQSALTNLGGSAIRIMQGATVMVTNGGVWTCTGTNGATDRGESMLSIKGGGELIVNGGTFAFTNIPRASSSYGNNVNVGYQSTGTLRVTAGRFDLYDRSAAPNVTHILSVGRDTGGQGVMRVDGGTVALGIQTAGETGLIVGNNNGVGSLVVSEGLLLFTNGVWNGAYYGLGGGQGELIVSNNGVVFGDQARHYIGHGNKSRGAVRIRGGSATFNSTYIGYQDGAGSSTGQIEVTGGTLKILADLLVGQSQNAGAAVGRIDSYGGITTCGLYYGMMVGYGKSGGLGSGALTMTGGVLRVSSNYGSDYAAGLLLGHIPENDANAATRSRGDLLMSGGVITNQGMFVVGNNGGTGVVVQTGGAFVQWTDSRYLTVLGHGLGASSYHKGGHGTYEQAGGSFYSPNRTYVGGVSPGVLPLANTGGVGRLVLSGGRFTCSNTVYVGANGAGVVSVASNGWLEANDVIVSNQVSGTLRFEISSAGTGRMTIKNALTLAPGAKLEIHLTGIPSARLLKLVDCGSRSGSFAPGDITVTGVGMAVVRQTIDEDIWLQVHHGTIIAIR